LLEAGAEVDARRADDQGTPLSGAACTNEIDTMRVLLDFGADVHAPCGFCPGSVLDFVKRLAENIAHRHEFRAMAELFAQHARCEVPDRAAMGRAAPVLYVSDMRRATDFYVNTLGFLCTYAQGDPASPIYAIVERGSAEIHLNAYKPEGRAGLCSCHVLADPIDDLFAEYEAAGLVFEQELNVQDWGLKDFVLRDPDGNRLEIGGPIRDREEG
jgi:catechol 2,3-dioxygenase-like lactoylglutathione lyase family enzyme